MLIITSYLLFISFSPGIHCKDKVYNLYSFTVLFSYIMSFFTSSNQITNFIKSGPVPMLPEEKYGGHIILLVCNMTTMGFKVFFVILMNGWMNDSNEHIDNDFWIYDNGFQLSTIRFVIILLICVLPTALFVSYQFKL